MAPDKGDTAGMIDSRGRPAGATYASTQPIETRTGKKGADGKWTSTTVDHTKEPSLGRLYAENRMSERTTSGGDVAGG